MNRKETIRREYAICHHLGTVDVHVVRIGGTLAHLGPVLAVCIVVVTLDLWTTKPNQIIAKTVTYVFLNPP
jgi:hypothetical protein